MQKLNNIYNASVEIVMSSDEARVIRVYPDGYKMKYKPYNMKDVKENTAELKKVLDNVRRYL